MRKPRINVVTLGCSKNLVDSEVLLGQLVANKADVVEDVDRADIAVINTCGFIESAKRESLDAILEAVQRKGRGQLKEVLVMGCLSERYKSDLEREVPEVDAYFGSHHLPQVLERIGLTFKSELLGERKLTTPSHFAYLKISEGCDRPCSFCAIPLMRGAHRSKDIRDVLEEASTLAASGVKELILIAQDSTSYGLDRTGRRQLGELLAGLAVTPGIEWIRLMYAYPAGFPRDVLSVIRDHPTICRYLDMPLQHIADPVLQSMRRGSTSRSTRELLETIRSEVPNIALRTTLMVGYPAETEQAFEELLAFVRDMKFHRLGVFHYSPEEGTASHSLGDPIPQAVKEERANALMELQQGISEERNQELIGSTVRVLFDRADNGHFVGRTEWDAPEIDQEVYVPNGPGLSVGNYFDVRIVDGTEYDLTGEIVEPLRTRGEL